MFKVFTKRDAPVRPTLIGSPTYVYALDPVNQKNFMCVRQSIPVSPEARQRALAQANKQLKTVIAQIRADVKAQCIAGLLPGFEPR